MLKSLCVIPARGGSKRIPKKNKRFFLGKPIIIYSIEAAIKSEIFDEIMVSTDDPEIAEIARKHGALVPFMRSQKNSDDYASTMDVINEVLIEYSNLGRVFDFVCCVYPTAPLIQAKHIISGFEKLTKDNLSCVFPSVEFSYPIWRSFEIEDKGNIRPFWSEHLNKRSQDLKKAFHDAGQWYWFQAKAIDNWSWPENSKAIILSEEEAQDIDNESDWKIAEMKYSMQRKNNT